MSFHPVTPDRRHSATQQKHRTREPKSKSKPAQKVLIVEDERLIAENIKLIIEDHNYQVVDIVSSGEEAIQKAKLTEPDLILMDVRIQGELDGVHAARVIQESLAKRPRVLFLSAHAREQFPHIDGLDSNSFLYLKKPYTPEDLLAAIEMLFAQAHDS